MFWCRDVKAINSVKLAVWFHDPPDVTDLSDVPDLSICLSIWSVWPVLCIWTVGAFGAIYLMDRRSFYLPVWSIYLPLYRSDLDLSIWFVYLIMLSHRSIYLYNYLNNYLPIYLSICLVLLSIYLSICLSVYLSIYLSICLTHLTVNLI